MTGQTLDTTGHVSLCPPPQMDDRTGQTWTSPLRGCPVVRPIHDPDTGNLHRAKIAMKIGTKTITTSARIANHPLASWKPFLVAIFKTLGCRLIRSIPSIRVFTAFSRPLLDHFIHLHPASGSRMAQEWLNCVKVIPKPSFSSWREERE